MRHLIVLIFVSSAFAQTPAPGSVAQQAWSLITDALGDKNPDTRVQAVQSMGLKLESRKAMVDQFIVDHIEKTPTEN